METFFSHHYILVISDKKVIITINKTFFPYFDYNTLVNITNTIISLLYPGETFKAPGTETTISISILNRPSVEKSRSGKEIQPELMEHGGIVHAKIEEKHCTTSADNHVFLNLDISISFFINKGKIATSRIQVYPTSDKFIPFSG